MESSIEWPAAKEMQVLEANWERLEHGLGLDLEGSARETKAFCRPRVIQCAKDQLRLGMAYGLHDWSYAQVALWAQLQGIGDLSGVAVRQRLEQMDAWLRLLIGQLLRHRCQQLSSQPGWKVKLQDATTVSRPGSVGTDARVHLELDLGNLCISGVAVTDASGGESLARFAAQPDEIRVADRGHAFGSGLGAVLKDGYLVVRINWQNLPLYTASGERFDLIAWLRGLTQRSETSVWVHTPHADCAVRLVAAPLSAEKAEAARRRARQNAAKKHHQVRDETLLAAGFLLLLTNLPTGCWGLEAICELYRLRWQIELAFKRYKSLLHLAQVRALDPTLLQICILCKLLAILLLDQLIFQVRLQQPDWFADPSRPVSIWGLTKLLWEGLRNLLCASITLQRIFACLPSLDRHLRSAPRQRQNQLAWALALLG